MLARLPDAPPGTKGISLFLVPKFLSTDGTRRNDVRAHSVEHKLGIHASPTCTMVYGDNGGAVGYLVGEENKGMACMFTMMNRARLAVGLQGVGDRRARDAAGAGLRARAQAGRRPAPSSHLSRRQAHAADHARADRAPRARSATPPASRIDRSQRGKSEAARKAAHERASLLTPVAKAFSTDIGIEVASLGVQVHGGMGFIEETGAAQHFRDARIAAIYEGTNGIQAIDLVTRKVPLDGGAAVAAYLDELRGTVTAVQASNDPAFGETGGAARRSGRQPRARDAMAAGAERRRDAALAGATPYLRLFGNAAGGCMLADEALAAHARGGRRRRRASRWRASSPRTSRCRPPASSAAVTEGAGQRHGCAGA